MDKNSEMVFLTDEEQHDLLEALQKVSGRNDWESVLEDDEEKMRKCASIMNLLELL